MNLSKSSQRPGLLPPAWCNAEADKGTVTTPARRGSVHRELEEPMLAPATAQQLPVPEVLGSMPQSTHCMLATVSAQAQTLPQKYCI